MSGKIFSYTFEPEIPLSYMGRLLDFVYQKYLKPQTERFTSISRSESGELPTLSFVVLDESRNESLRVQVEGSKPLKIEIAPLSKKATEQAIDQVRQDILIAAELFEEKVQESSLFFAWREGEEIVPEQVSGKEKRSINRIFLETQVLLMVIFVVLGFALLTFVGFTYAPIILLVVQFIFVFYSNKLIERTADWRITEDNPTIHLLEYSLPVEEHDKFREKYPPRVIAQIKKDIYEQTIAKRGEIDCSTVGEVFRRYQIDCSPENFTAKKMNVYELVKKTANKFKFPMPKIVVSNTLAPNAAASGPSPSRGVVLITTGLFVQLEEDEILTVLGHEFGHLKGRDPLVLFGLMGSEFLFRFYVVLTFFPIIFSSLLLFFVYFWGVMTLLYFIAKFFEARADLVSAIVMQQPETLATALEEIGFKRLLIERVPSYRIQEWVGMDPHPPIYFRVDRLRKFKTDRKVKFPLYQSAKDVVRGFLDSL